MINTLKFVLGIIVGLGTGLVISVMIIPLSLRLGGYGTLVPILAIIIVAIIWAKNWKKFEPFFHGLFIGLCVGFLLSATCDALFLTQK